MALAAAVVAAPLGAQGRGRNTNGVPPGQRPPPGMCRVWIAGVPPGQQPAATDCVTARLNAPPNSRVIYGGSGQRAGSAAGGIFGRRVYRQRGNQHGDQRGNQHGNQAAYGSYTSPAGILGLPGIGRSNGVLRNGGQGEHYGDRDGDDGGRWKAKGNGRGNGRGKH